MPDFDFITDAEFRAALESDYRELEICMEASAYKAVLVLSGGIIEAVLADYLIGAGKRQPDPTKMTLDQLITAASAEGVLSDKTKQLAEVIRFYRNLIHPGRLIRLGEKADLNSARVAVALVDMILDEVAAKQRVEYGLTAEQLIAKFEGDPTAPSIAKLLLADANESQVERLLLDLLPRRYFELLEVDILDRDEAALAGLSRLYRAAVDRAEESVQKKVAKRFVKILREETGERVAAFEENFFRGHDLAHLTKNEILLIKEHLGSRLNERVSEELLEALDGIGLFLDEDDVARILDPLIRDAVYRDDSDPLGIATRNRIEQILATTPPDFDSAALTRLQQWVGYLENRDLDEAIRRARVMESSLEFRMGIDDIPF